MIKGINQNVHPESVSPDYIYWAKNFILNSKLDAFVNNKGTLADLNLTDAAYRCGYTTILDTIIILYKDQTNRDCILTKNTKTGVSTLKVARTDLNFNQAYPIRIKAKYNAKGELIIAFTDDLNPPRYINLDTADPSDNINFYNLFPINYSASNITAEILEGGGNVTTGAYLMTFQYLAKDRSRTQFTTISNPTYITTVDANQTFIESDASNTGQASNKAIKYTLTDLDTSYQKIAIAIISKVNGVISQRYIKEIPLTNSTLSFVFNGVENIGDVTLDELLTDKVIYTKAKAITSVNDQLFLADVEVAADTDFQDWANQTQIQWVSKLDYTNTIAATSKYKAGNTKTFIHDEVVALYIQFELNVGGFSKWFHIPGRAATVGEKADSSLSMGGLQINGRNPKVYEVEDTCTYIGNLVSDAGTVTSYGDMGVWENINETYPSSYGSLAGEKVRHHKFPSIEYIDRNVHGSVAGYAINCLDILGLRITNAAIDYTQVKGFRIGFAKRNLSEVGVLGMGLTMFGASPSLVDTPPSQDTNKIMSAAGNVNISSLNAADDNIIINRGYLRFNSFDIWQDRPALTGTYLRNYVKLIANKLASSAAGYNNAGNTYGQIHPGSGSFDLVSYISNFTVQGANNTTKEYVASADRVRKLSNQSYIPNNVSFYQDSLFINNLGSEEHIFAKIEGAAIDIDFLGALETQTNNSADDPAMGEETYLAAIKNAKSDYFLDFENQIVVTNPTIFRSGVTNNLLEFGEGFIGVHSYTTVASYNKNVDPLTNETEKIVNFKVHVGVGRHNVNLRYQVLGDYSTYFYPAFGTFGLAAGDVDKYWFYSYSRKSSYNNFQYNKDYSLINDLETFGVYSRDIETEEDLAFRILRSNRASRENALEDGWRSFSLLDYFDTVRDRGAIVNIEAWGSDSLIIHHESSLYRTRDKAVLRADIISISLGSGDIFEIEPREERISKEGYGGTQHYFSCLMTPYGYFYVDELTGRVHLYDGQTIRDIGAGLTRFFKDNLDCTADNPNLLPSVVGQHIALMSAYDDEFNLILLSQKAGKSFTLAFDPTRMEWVQAFDWVPEGMFNSRSNLYSFKNSILYKHNVGDRGKYYGTLYPSYIDFIVNTENTVDKVLESISWFSKLYNVDGSIDHRNTVTSITIWNDQYCTDKITLLTNETKSLFKDANVKVVKEAWNFNTISDNVIDPSLPFISSLLTDSRPISTNIKKPVWYDAEPLRGKFFIVRLEFSNESNKELHVRELFSSLRKSQI